MNQQQYFEYLKQAKRFISELQGKFEKWDEKQQQRALEMITAQITKQLRQYDTVFLTETTFKHDVVTYLWNLLHDLEKKKKNWQGRHADTFGSPHSVNEGFTEIFTRFIQIIDMEIAFFQKEQVPPQTIKPDNQLISWINNDDLYQYISLIERACIKGESVSDSEWEVVNRIRRQYSTSNAPSRKLGTFSVSHHIRDLVLRFIASNLEPLKEASKRAKYVLDLACGLSNALPYSLKKNLFPSNTYVGVDLDITNIATRYLASRYPSKTIQQEVYPDGRSRLAYLVNFQSLGIKYAFDPDFSKLDVYVHGNVFQPQFQKDSAFLIFFDNTLFDDNDSRVHTASNFPAILNLIIEGGYYIETDISELCCYVKKNGTLQKIYSFKDEEHEMYWPKPGVPKKEPYDIRKVSAEKAKEIFPRLPHVK
ncbi:MAG: hypothetical protein AABX70_02195 [Nanoarchaeota archaeon]